MRRHRAVAVRYGLYPLVVTAAARVGNITRLAAQLGITASALLRAAKRGRLGTDFLLTIAEVGGLDPDQLLRAGEKAETADRLKRLYGEPRVPLSADQQQLLALDPEAQRQLCRLIDGLTK